jgi:uncharacterized protein YbjQ (UPF0145 family)
VSNYGQQPNPYGRNQPGQNQPGQPGQHPYGQQGGQPYQQPQQPYGQQPSQPYGQQPWAPPNQPQAGPQPYGQQPQYPQPGQPQPSQPQPGGWTPQPASTARPTVASRAIAVVTMETVPGREIATVIGDVVGVVVRPRELSPELRAGNPLDGYATMLTRSRQDAVTKMIDMAVAAGADAVVGFRYDCSEITQSLSEVSAYGTAVKLAAEAGTTADSGAAQADESDNGPIRDEASSATTLSRPASGSTPAGPTRRDQNDSDSGDRPWPPSSWPSQS